MGASPSIRRPMLVASVAEAKKPSRGILQFAPSLTVICIRLLPPGRRRLSDTIARLARARATACIAPKSERRTVRSIADAKDRLVTVNSALPKASALDPQPVLGGMGDVSNRLYGILMIA